MILNFFLSLFGIPQHPKDVVVTLRCEGEKIMISMVLGDTSFQCVYTDYLSVSKHTYTTTITEMLSILTGSKNPQKDYKDLTARYKSQWVSVWDPFSRPEITVTLDSLTNVEGYFIHFKTGKRRLSAFMAYKDTDHQLNIETAIKELAPGCNPREDYDHLRINFSHNGTFENLWTWWENEKGKESHEQKQ